MRGTLTEATVIIVIQKAAATIVMTIMIHIVETMGDTATRMIDMMTLIATTVAGGTAIITGTIIAVRGTKLTILGV